MRVWWLAAGVALLSGGTSMALAERAGRMEMREAQRWAAAKLDGEPETAEPAVGLEVLANNDPVQCNARAGKPMSIAGRRFMRGLYCHAVSRVLVRLPAPAARFTALVGIDSNEQTSGGRGSVVFRVQAGGRELFRSALLREGMPAVPLSVDLGGANELELLVDDGGDGIACDQADWADARVELADGGTVWLGDMPIGGARPPYSADLPFSFVYGGRSSADLLPGWRRERASRALDAARTEQTTTWTDPRTGLEVRWAAVRYADFPTVEWTLHFRNGGSADLPLLSEVRALDTRFARAADGEFVLNHSRGTRVAADDFEPLRTVMEPGRSLRFAPPGGRPLGTVFPYFNLEWPGEGVIVVVGWPGQWEGEFARDDGAGIRVTAGQEKVSLRLSPGEEIRTPLIVLQFWKGERLHAQNVWRQWMLAHNVPRPGGMLPPPHHAACSSHQFAEMIDANEENQIQFVDRYLEERLKLDYWWMDAGWYVNKSGWPNTGTWEVDTRRFPRGLRAITDHARMRGVRSIVWFEPERVTPGTWLYEQRPEWLLGRDGEQKLLNLGDERARRWLVEHVDRLIVEQGIDLYRQDYNVDPLGYWRAADAPDRQGATENHYVSGYLRYWDELLRRHPAMLIDTCASGGHRNDLETLRRSVPLLRSDYILEPVGQQAHTYGLSFWIPLCGTGQNAFDAYTFRSQMGFFLNTCHDLRRRDADWKALRKLVAEWRRTADSHYGDYYPLTPYSLDDGAWMAWQLHRPDEGRGLVQAFRRGASIYESARMRLHGLDERARYEVIDLDRPRARRTLTGGELMSNGLPVAIPSQPGAAMLVYRRVSGGR
ncbi:MAG: NPCBM/NEW2 domain-containing protein [Chthonomonadales bacterium]|nr:NPCBM/NEW2 domain-containing protein [Chthonomonadales bacterium]